MYSVIRQKCLQNEISDYKKYMLDVDYTREDFVNKFPEARTFPQITMDGNYIGGFTELDAHLA